MKKNTIYGYCRISKKTQIIDRQIKNIKGKYPEAIIIQEAFTGTRVEGRKEFNKLLNRVKSGDKIVFDSVSRMSRNADEGIELYMELFNKGVELEFIKEQHINTSTYKKALTNNIKLTGTNVDFILKGINEYLLALAREQIKLAFDQAEKEVRDLQERTKEGLREAKARGVKLGVGKGSKITTKKSIAVKKLIRKYSRDFNGSNTDKEVIGIIKNDMNVSRNSYYKYKKELILELEQEQQESK